jgi:hypothetical protein
MAPISYCRHRFPAVVIQHAVWLYLRFTLSRQSRNQTGGRRQNSSSAVRAILDDPPIGPSSQSLNLYNQTRERGTKRLSATVIRAAHFLGADGDGWQFYEKGRPKPPLETDAPITSGKSSRSPRCPGSARGGHWRRRQNVYRGRCPAPRRNPRHRRSRPGRT